MDEFSKWKQECHINGISDRDIWDAAYSLGLAKGRKEGMEVACSIMVKTGRDRCASRGVDPDSAVFDHGCDHIKAMASESMACSEQAADAIRQAAQGGETPSK